MKDIDKYIDLFKQTGVGYKVEDFDAYKNEYDEEIEDEVTQAIVLNVGENNIVGYSSFYTEILFDKDGKFIRIGLYE